MTAGIVVAVGALRCWRILAIRGAVAWCIGALGLTRELAFRAGQAQNQRVCRNTNEIRGWGCGFMLRAARDAAEI